MAFLDVFCPECHSIQKVYRKRNSGIRYSPFQDETGVTIGEFRYYQLYCHTCKILFYLQERYLYGTPETNMQKIIVAYDTFQKASLHKPGTIRIGTTASEYTLMIAAGADCSYALNQLAQ